MPDYVSPPGDTLIETLEALNMTQVELAERMGRPKKTINEIIQGKTAITAETALQLERVVGVPADFWLRLEQNYRESLARLQDDRSLEEQLPWLRDLPIKSMVKWGWIDKVGNALGQLREVLRFFGVVDKEQYELLYQEHLIAKQMAFRKSAVQESNPHALAAWLRQGEIEAQNIVSQAYDKTSFRQALDTIRSLTTQPLEVFQPKVIELCALAGVAVAFVPDLPRTMACGATRWLSSNKALIQLSLRYKSDDQLWFTFFHEAAHILLHGKNDFFLEGVEVQDNKEQEANRWATDFLIPPDRLNEFKQRNPSFKLSKAGIKEFAAELGIAPGIVVGRLQYDKYLPIQNCNGLKVRLDWINPAVDEETAF